MKRKNWISVLILLSASLFLFVFQNIFFSTKEIANSNKKIKLYWFIPDGFRADPVTMRVFDWAKNGELPNIGKLMREGSYGYSIPVFPGHTPTNTATLVTGSTPRVHGVSDGAMRAEGYPVKMVAKNGFSSTAKRVPPIWYTLEQNGFNVTLLSMPGSTPPELRVGTTIRGRWGGWGVDFPAINFQSNNVSLMSQMGLDHRSFGFGPELTQFIEVKDITNWNIPLPKSFSAVKEVQFKNWGSTTFALIYDSVDDGLENYDRMLFSFDKNKILADLTVGQQSEWLSTRLYWEVKNDYNIHSPKNMNWERSLSSIAVDTQFNIRVIKLGEKGFFRVRFFYNNLNEYVVQPADLAQNITKSVGPMVDFVDNYPPQLIYYQEDKQAFLDESHASMDWHRRMLNYIIEKFDSDVVIQNIYTPNQMLTSRWWLSYIDPKGLKYSTINEAERTLLWSEVKQMYQKIDAILGEAMKNMDKNSYIVLSSDHGAIPLNREVRLNNIFAKKGWLKFKMNQNTGEAVIDWSKTRVVYLQMNNIYINPNGLDAIFKRVSGAEYERLRKEVHLVLSELRDGDGIKPLERAVNWENAQELGLPNDRVGDVLVVNHAGYNWIEELTVDGEVFKNSLKGGYKQAVNPNTEEGMWTPFIISGPGVKRGYKLKKPISHIDQYPTIMKLLNQPVLDFVEGKALDEIFTK